MTNTITTTPSATSVIEPSFSFSPFQSVTFVAGGGIQQTSPAVIIEQTTTFVASTSIFDTTGRLSIVSYYWDFGDGTISAGATATHKYIINNPHAVVTLRVTDNFGQVWSARSPIYLSGLGNPPTWNQRTIEWSNDNSTWASNA